MLVVGMACSDSCLTEDGVGVLDLDFDFALVLEDRFLLSDSEALGLLPLLSAGAEE